MVHSTQTNTPIGWNGTQRTDQYINIWPIVVVEAFRRLTGKCLCTMARVKASEFFGLFQLGVACPAGVEKLVHGLRWCIRDHCEDDDFVACKVDLRNAFNEVSQKTLKPS